ncbi:hypothetical protein BDU57DRAFT_518946 [Ampelomyces quisqualis]|uniref:MYND-type domain-containing protein n=1 Tax=Ampelomyces quisqualis TaxID=50730 RepID=A0A6A5QHG4_AMPQU|nr:hypothetical protein BDU57DRAFT_518946 [Ampelomyces quisqualis]
MSSTAPQDFGYPLVLEDFMPVIQPPTANSPSHCAVCHAVVNQSKKCSGCKNIIYCSKSCQTANWAQHKTLCKAYTNASRPTTQHRRAVLFAAEQARARFIWLRYGSDGTPLDMTAWFPDMAQGDDNDVRTVAFHSRFLPYWIQLSFDGNTSGTRSLDSNAAIQCAFRGPVVAVAYDAEEGLGKPALDADTRLLGPVLDYARLRAEYAGPVFVEQPQERYTEEDWARIRDEAAANQGHI